MLRRATFTVPRAMAVRRLSSEIPIGMVARVMRMDVAGEEEAMKADAIVKSMEPDLKAMPGYVKMVRQVCKSEWAYEGAIVFDSLDNFKNYMGSTERESTVPSQPERRGPLASLPLPALSLPRREWRSAPGQARRRSCPSSGRSPSFT